MNAYMSLARSTRVALGARSALNAGTTTSRARSLRAL